MIPCSFALIVTCLINVDFTFSLFTSAYVCFDAVCCREHVTLLRPVKKLHLPKRIVMLSDLHFQRQICTWLLSYKEQQQETHAIL